MKKGIKALLVLGILAAAAGGGYYYYSNYMGGSSEGRVSSDAENAVYVSSVSAIAGLGSGTGTIQRYAGVVVPQETWSVKLEGEEKVKETYVKEGDEVKAGDKLFTYDTSEDEDKLAQDEIDIERSENDIETSKKQLEQLNKEMEKASQDNKLSYSTQILSEENSIKQNEYEIKTKKLEIENLKESINNADVFSKIDGVVKKINDSSDTSSLYTSDTSDAYITIMQIGDYRVEASVNEQNINEIYEDTNVLCYSRVDSSQYWKGTITEIKRDGASSGSDTDSDSDGSSSYTGSSKYPFYVQLENSDNLLLGQHLYIELDQGQAEVKEGIWIPQYYITQEADGSAWVWAAAKNNVLEKRTVTLGDFDEELGTYQITEGLAAEDYITMPDDSYSAGDPLIYNEDSDVYYDSSYDGGDYDISSLAWDGSLDEDDGFWDESGSTYEEYYLDELGSVYEEYSWEDDTEEDTEI